MTSSLDHVKPPSPDGYDEFSLLAAEVESAKLRGEWRTGPRTLMGVLGVHNGEVMRCRGLAWLLTPDGWHGLGSGLLDLVLERLGVDSTGSERATVGTEEHRENTRADLIIRFESTTVLIEAKVGAVEGDRQCDRLAYHWRDESPTLVFLTRGGKAPTTAVESEGRWQCLAWTDLADLLGAAVAASSAPESLAPGVFEFLETLKVYGEATHASADVKTDFYLKHRESIERWATTAQKPAANPVHTPTEDLIDEWAALQKPAAKQLSDAIVAAAQRMAAEDDRLPVPVIGNGTIMGILYPVTPVPDGMVSVGVQWTRHTLLKPGADLAWPLVGITMPVTDSRELHAALKAAVIREGKALKLTRSTPWWPRFGLVLPESEPLDIEEYADHCMHRVREVWTSLHYVIESTVAQFTSSLDPPMG